MFRYLFYKHSYSDKEGKKISGMKLIYTVSKSGREKNPINLLEAVNNLR